MNDGHALKVAFEGIKFGPGKYGRPNNGARGPTSIMWSGASF